MNENIGPLALNLPLIVTQIIGFLLLLWFLNRFVFKPIFGILDERQRLIKESYDQMDADRARMEQTRREYEQRLHGIEEEAREKIQAAVKEAQGLRDSLISDAHAHADSIIQQGRNESERDRQKAFLEMRSQIVSLAVAAAGKVIDENLTDARQTKMVDDFIGSLGNGSAPAAAKSGASAYSNGSSESLGAA
ncbi:MAG: F0F1 ATP synthase subunit B [Janthinobacterium lividum]